MKNIVIPFKGIRYNTNIIKSPEKFVCWPYDIINKKQQDMFYKKGPYNVIRMALGKEEKNDSARNNKYTRANKFLRQCLKKGILKKEDKPIFYIYQQDYKIPFTNEKKTVYGFIGLVKLQYYRKKRILPHEDTFTKPIEDRYLLTHATNTQISPIYSLYTDKNRIIDNILAEQIKKNKPQIDYKENDSIRHRFWVMTDEESIKKVENSINSKLIYIADGHHRYQTHLDYKKIYRKEQKIARRLNHPVKYMMMFLVNSAHPGLSILPCHRVLYNLKDLRLKQLLAHIKDYFHLKVFTFNSKKEEKKEKERFLYLLKTTPSNSHSFGIYLKNMKRFFLLTLKNQDAYLKMARVDRSIAWKSLDSTIMHTLLIDYILHITKKDVSNQIYIDYIMDHNLAIDKVNNDKHQVAIIMNPTKVSEVLKIAKLSEKMPQKSTYFFPKLLTGLVLNQMKDNF